MSVARFVADRFAKPGTVEHSDLYHFVSWLESGEDLAETAATLFTYCPPCGSTGEAPCPRHPGTNCPCTKDICAECA